MPAPVTPLTAGAHAGARGGDSSAPRVLRGEEISVSVDPRRGGRIASIVHLPSRREWLTQPTLAREPAAYGSSFSAGEMAGWDEMFPTIAACTHPGPGSAAGAVLPDHGEVWTLPWRLEAAVGTESLTLSVEGRALPYRLKRHLHIGEPATLVLEYSLEVLGSEPLPLLWACHPQFDCSPGTSIGLPDSVTEILDVTEGPPGTSVAWPSHGLAQVAQLPEGTGRKLVVPADVRVAEAELRDPRGTRLRLRWSPVQLPHLGLWLDNGYLARQQVAVIEPSDGFFDNLAYAAAAGHAAITRPEAPRHWQLEVDLGWA